MSKHTYTHTLHTHTHTPHQGTVRLQCVPKHYIPESRDARLLHSTATKHSDPLTLSVLKGTWRPVCWLNALQNSYHKSYSAFFFKGTTIRAMTQINHDKSLFFFFYKASMMQLISNVWLMAWLSFLTQLFHSTPPFHL